MPGIQSGLGPGQQQGHPGDRNPRDHSQQQDLRRPRRHPEEVDAAHRQGSVGGRRALHVPAQHGAHEVHHGGPQRHHQARHRGRDGSQSRLRGRQCEVEISFDFYYLFVWSFGCELF